MAAGARPVLRLVARLGDTLLYAGLQAAAHVLRALPARWVLAFADGAARVIRLLDRRGRRAGRQNLDVAFGEGMSADEKRRILGLSYRQAVRSLLLLLHVSPMTRERYRRWVDVPDDDLDRLLAYARRGKGGVLFSGHVGNWELLLGLGHVHDDLPTFVFMAEALTRPALNRFLASLRGTGGGASALSHGGARTLDRVLKNGGGAAVLADRNVRRRHGGRWAPFLGLPARTTPLPGWLGRRHGTVVVPVLCLPQDDGRYRIWVGPDVAEGAHDGDEEADIQAITERMNRVLEEIIRARPEIWNWTLKRFKSRPTRELGPYPPYSLWDPD